MSAGQLTPTSRFSFNTQLLQVICLIILSVPNTILVFSLFASTGDVVIMGIKYTLWMKACFIIFLVATMMLIIYTLLRNKWQALSLALAGSFIFLAGTAHLIRLFYESRFKLLGTDMKPIASKLAVIGLIPLGVFTLIMAYLCCKNISDSKLGKLFPLTWLWKRINQHSPMMAMTYGLFASAALSIPAALSAYWLATNLLQELFHPLEMKLIIWIGLVGAQGSVVSIFMRMGKFSSGAKKKDNIQLFMVALTRPFIGFSLAHLSYFMLKSGIINLGGESDSIHFLVAVAFSTGFAERIAANPFAKD